MNKKIFLLGLVLLLIGQLRAAEEPSLITIKADGKEYVYALADVQRIVFAEDSDTMIAEMKGETSEVTDIVNVSFGMHDFSDVKAISTSYLAVFPNPVHTTLTITGADAGSKIDLYGVNGTLLQSVPAQSNATDIDVSSLESGTYFLRVGTKSIKFVKN